MCIVTIFEQLAMTPHHKIDFNELLKGDAAGLQQAFANKDATYLKALFNEKTILADRTTIFEL